jgi:hypothetical protein
MGRRPRVPGKLLAARERFQRPEIATGGSDLHPSSHRAAKPGKGMARPGERSDGEVDDAIGVTPDDKGLFTHLRVGGKRPVGEPEGTGFVNDVDDPAGGHRRDERQPKRHDHHGPGGEVRSIRSHGQASASMGLPPTQSEHGPLEDPIARTQDDRLLVVPVSIGQLSTGRTDVVVGQGLGGLFGHQPVKFRA